LLQESEETFSKALSRFRVLREHVCECVATSRFQRTYQNPLIRI
jgi:hypothetical protein